MRHDETRAIGTAASPATTAALRALKITYGLVPLVAGLDKLTNLLVRWETYLSPAAVRLLPVSPGIFMRAVGLIEIAVGLAVLTRHTRLGAYVAMAWLIAIGLSLVAAGHYDVAVRDFAMSVGAFALAKLTEARAAVRAVEEKPLAPSSKAAPLGGRVGREPQPPAQA